MGDEDQSNGGAGGGASAADSVADSVQKVSLTSDQNKDSVDSDANAGEDTSGSSATKVYVGGLASEVDEEGLKTLLKDKSLPEAEAVLVKRGGYAFLEFSDQSQANDVISALDGKITSTKAFRLGQCLVVSNH